LPPHLRAISEPFAAMADRIMDLPRNAERTVALRKLLDEGHVGGAGFDVFSSEPAKENPLFGSDKVVATPHLGASTNEAQEIVALQVAEQISDYLLTGAVTNALNSPSVNAEEAPRLKP
jgi:D-3-phosphoglycerate dehydrogenase